MEPIDSFFKACDTDNHLIIPYLINKGLNTDFAIGFAASFGCFEILKCFLELGVDFNVDNNYAVRYSAANGHLNILKYLFEKGAKDDNNRGLTLAAEYGRIDVVKFLLQHNSSRMYDDGVKFACQFGHLEVVKILFNNGANLRSEHDFCIRRSQNYPEIINFLVENGVPESLITSQRCKKYVEICRKSKHRAQKKIYFWWIPICYNLDHPSGCGKRMRQKNYNKFLELCES